MSILGIAFISSISKINFDIDLEQSAPVPHVCKEKSKLIFAITLEHLVLLGMLSAHTAFYFSAYGRL